jgi:hypothetical protein
MLGILQLQLQITIERTRPHPPEKDRSIITYQQSLGSVGAGLC